MKLSAYERTCKAIFFKLSYIPSNGFIMNHSNTTSYTYIHSNWFIFFLQKNSIKNIHTFLNISMDSSITKSTRLSEQYTLCIIVLLMNPYLLVWIKMEMRLKLDGLFFICKSAIDEAQSNYIMLNDAKILNVNTEYYIWLILQ